MSITVYDFFYDNFYPDFGVLTKFSDLTDEHYDHFLKWSRKPEELVPNHRLIEYDSLRIFFNNCKTKN